MMTKHDEARVLSELMQCAENAHAEFTKARQRGYLEDLADLPADLVIRAIRIARKEEEFFPSVATLRRLAGHSNNKQALEDRAALAWDNLRSLRGKAYRESALECPITAKCFRALGGKMNFGMWDYDAQEQWKRKEFISLYTAYARDTRITQEFDQVESQGILQQITNNGLQRPS